MAKHVDDDPGDTAAERWLETTLGIATRQKAKTQLDAMLRRAFRSGYLIGRDCTEADEMRKEQ